MTAFNYGKRFNSSAVRVSAPYDRALDSSTWKGWRPSAPVAGTLDAVMRASHGQAAMAAKRRAVPKVEGRASHEAKMAERIAKTIEILEFGLEELNNAPAATRDEPAQISRIQVMKAVEILKSKCGLYR